MAVTIYYENDVNPEVIKGKKVAIIGYGSPGPCPCAQPHGLGRRRSRWPARRLQELG